MMWNGLPIIRKELASCMINKFGLTQKQTAKKLGITPAAVCQYLKKKRGEKIKIKIVDDVIKEEITISAKRIIESGNGSVKPETCRICQIIKQHKKFNDFCIACEK
ncbi:MAG: Fis family transcriptional regulator [Candidatus Thermoplasmatota archaeon]